MEPNKSILSRFDTVNSTGLILRIKSIIYDLMFDHILNICDHIYMLCKFRVIIFETYSSLTICLAAI